MHKTTARRPALASACVLVSLAAAGGASQDTARDAAYPRADLIAEPGEMSILRRRSDRPLVIVDTRAPAAHAEGHVPGAVSIDLADWSKSFGDGTDADGWSRRIGKAGIGPQSRVVVYDDASLRDAARVWWILRYWGVEDARLLNGAWKGWRAAGEPVETGPVTAPAPVVFPAKASPGRLATRKGLLAAIADPSSRLQILDTRSEAEHCGTDKLTNRRGGAIPGARHLDWVDLLDAQTQRFKPAAELRRLLAAAGIDPARPVAAHCQSGGRASVAVFALELLGAREASNYYASWAEWGNADDTPVVPGKPRAAADPDLSVQGEYAGTIDLDGRAGTAGAQVIARGKGKFDAVLLRGGLPGAGWDRGAKLRFSGRTEGTVTRLAAVAAGPVAALEVHSGDPAAGRPASLHALDAQGKSLGELPRVARQSPTLGAPPPPGALVLFDGSSTEQFRTAAGKPATATADRLLRVERGSGGLFSVPPHGACALHLEFRLPFEPEHEGQGRANSGCYLQGRYEVQILDSFGLEGRENECGGVYSSGKHPEQNLCLPPMAWQTYDIRFTPAAYGPDGNKTAAARLTVAHNGVEVYRDLEIDHATTASPRREGPDLLPLYLQDHGHEVHFRNIWLVRH